jgi:hypothetical protein
VNELIEQAEIDNHFNAPKHRLKKCTALWPDKTGNASNVVEPDPLQRKLFTEHLIIFM